MSIREFKGSPVTQGIDESIPYTVTTTRWGSSPTSPTVVAYDESDMSDVTGTVFPDPPTATKSGDVITLPLLSSLTEGHTYRIEVKWNIGTAIHEGFGRVIAER